MTKIWLVPWTHQSLSVKIVPQGVKKVWRKRKEKIFKLRNWLLLHVKRYKTCCWITFVIRKCIYLNSAGWWSSGWWSDDEVAMYLWYLWSSDVPMYLWYILLVDDLMMKWLYTSWPTINNQTRLNKPMS